MSDGLKVVVDEFERVCCRFDGADIGHGGGLPSEVPSVARLTPLTGFVSTLWRLQS
jgi:hypothetical protein